MLLKFGTRIWLHYSFNVECLHLTNHQISSLSHFWVTLTPLFSQSKPLLWLQWQLGEKNTWDLEVCEMDYNVIYDTCAQRAGK